MIFFVSFSYFNGSNWKICISVRRNLLWKCTTHEGKERGFVRDNVNVCA